MRSLREAEEALRVYDIVAGHWQHPPGAQTAYHTSLHLAAAVFRGLAKVVAERASFSASDAVWLNTFFFELCGRFVEHAIRLSRVCEQHLTSILLEVGDIEPEAGIEEWFRRRLQAQEQMGSSWRILLFMELAEQLAVLLQLCERSDHGVVVEWNDGVRAAVSVLMRCAAAGGLPGGGIHISNVLAEFEYRLRELQEKNEYAVARA